MHQQSLVTSRSLACQEGSQLGGELNTSVDCAEHSSLGGRRALARLRQPNTGYTFSTPSTGRFEQAEPNRRSSTRIRYSRVATSREDSWPKRAVNIGPIFWNSSRSLSWPRSNSRINSLSDEAQDRFRVQTSTALWCEHYRRSCADLWLDLRSVSAGGCE